MRKYSRSKISAQTCFRLLSVQNNRNQRRGRKIIRLFQGLTLTEKEQLLSNVILEASLHFEKLIDQTDSHDIGALANKLQGKMFHILANESYASDATIYNIMLQAILKPGGWLGFFKGKVQPQAAIVNSENYRVITAEEVQSCIGGNNGLDSLKFMLNIDRGTQIIL